LPEAMRPYAVTAPVRYPAKPPTDAVGVKRFVFGCESYPPVAIAQQGLAFLESYRIGGGLKYLVAARRHADRLLAESVTIDGATYLPYQFRFSLARDPAHVTFAPPWFSAMAEGQALSLCVRLFEVTGDARYRAAADGLFASFLLTRSPH